VPPTARRLFSLSATAYPDLVSQPPATPEPPRPPAPTWRAHAAAVFVTFHLACVLLYALPRPPALDDAALRHREVKAELEQSFNALHKLIPWRSSPQKMQEDVIRLVRGYAKVTDDIREIISPYLEAAGSTQSWHMFAGTPPRFPLVFVVEVRPRGEKDFVLFQDLRWGTADAKALNFRHRKAQELLSFFGGVRDWDAYAAWWARCWDERHPDRPAWKVRLSYLRLTTPAPEEVRRGHTDRRPELVLDPEPYEWERWP
jgi:hypothetical protein